MPSKFADSGKLLRHRFPACALLTISSLALTGAFSSALAGTVQSLSFEKNTLVITGTAPFSKDVKLQSWNSEDGDAPTRMIVLDLPDTAANTDTLGKTIDGILSANPQIHRLIMTPLTDHTLRVLLEIANAPDDASQPGQPAIESSGNAVRLLLSGEPGAAAATPSCTTEQLAREKSLLNELVLSNQELTRKNRALEAEIARLKTQATK